MTPPRLDGHDHPERDAWLAEALRHAPDADAAPPAALREAILREARAASAGSRAVPAPSTAHRLLAAWSRLARPPVAAGFASVMVTTVIGLMWWDQPIDETLQRPPMPTSTSAPGVQPPAAAAPSPAADRTGVRPTPPTLPTRPAPAVRADKAAGDQGATAPTLRMRESTPLPKDSPAPATSGALTSAPRKSEAAAPTAPLTEWLASVAEQPQRWSWQRSDNAQPMSPALRRWLQQLDRAAASQWRAPPGAARPGEGSAVRLYRDDTLYATLRLDDDAVWLDPASPAARPLRAALPAAALADLKRALDEATP